LISCEELTEEKALAIVAFNLKRKKRDVDMLTIQEAIDYLRKLYGSLRQVEKRAGVSYEMLREFLLIKRLPEIKHLIKTRKIDSVEIVEEISKLKEVNKRKELAENIVKLKLTTKDVRDIVQYINANPEISIEDCIQRVLKSKSIVEKRFMVVMELKESTLDMLKREAEKLSVSIEDLAKSIFENLKIKDLKSCDIRDKLIAITVLKSGLKDLKARAKDLKVSLEELGETVIYKWLSEKS